MTVPASTGTVVVGAGFAGLAAARRLRAAGRTVHVFEARGRVGGRTWNLPVADGVITEGGGQYIGPTQTRLQALADAYGVATYPSWTSGTTAVTLDGQPVETEFGASTPDNDLPDLVTGLQDLADQVPVDAPWDAPAAREWDSRTLDDWLTEHARTRLGLELMRSVATTMFGSDATTVSLLFAAHYIASAGDETTPGSLLRLIRTEGGAQDRRFVGGSQLVAERIAAELGDALTLDAPVSRIVHDATTVLVESARGTTRAASVIVAVPPQRAAAIEYDPPLPVLRRRLLEGLPLGALAKYHAVYDTPFWRSAGRSGNSFHAGEHPLTVTFDNSPPDGSVGVLFGFAGGARGRELAALPPDDRRDQVLRAFAAVVGERARHPRRFLEVDWAAEPWTGGGPGSCAPPGLLTDCGHVLRDPVGPIHWAGTETAVHWTGYIEGAVRSGERAADEVLRIPAAATAATPG